jgi:hypothetical protein
MGCCFDKVENVVYFGDGLLPDCGCLNSTAGVLHVASDGSLKWIQYARYQVKHLTVGEGGDGSQSPAAVQTPQTSPRPDRFASSLCSFPGGWYLDSDGHRRRWCSADCHLAVRRLSASSKEHYKSDEDSRPADGFGSDWARICELPTGKEVGAQEPQEPLGARGARGDCWTQKGTLTLLALRLYTSNRESSTA